MKRALIRTAAFIRGAKRIAKRQPQTIAAIRDALQLLEEDAFYSRLRNSQVEG